MRPRKNADFKGLFLGIHERGDCEFGDGKTRGCPLSKDGVGGGGGGRGDVVSQSVPKTTVLPL